MGVEVNSSHAVSAAPSSSGEDSSHSALLQHEVPVTGDSSPQTAPAWVVPTGCSPSGTGCSSVGPHGVKSPASKPALAWAPLSMGPQVQPGACSSTGSPRGHSFPQASTCSGVGSLPRAAGGYLLHHGPPWLQASPWSAARAAGDPLLQCLEHLFPPFCTDLGVCRVVSLTYSHSSLSTAIPQQVFPFLK